MYEMFSFKQDGKRNKFFLMVLFVFITIFTSQAKPTHFSKLSRAKTLSSSPCKDTLYPEACQSLILSSKNEITPTTVGDMFSLSLKSSIDQAHATRSLAYNVTQMTQTMMSSNSHTHLDDCIELLDQSLDQLSKIHMMSTSQDDIQTWLSAAITHQTICLDGFQNEKLSKEKANLDANLRNNIQHISNSLALHKSLVVEQAKTLKGKGSRRLLSDDFPTWISSKDRKLLETPIEDLETSAVVALDGTGTHKTISEAIAFVSLAGSGRKVIHVAAGTYSESSLKISLKQSNLMLVGDGKGRTVITGSKNAGDGSTTFNSATFGVAGDGFIARDISFVNSAGPGGSQAVALRVTSDRSVFYRCSVHGYQDTLYTVSNRQFYRETDIYGTVDFIFGNSAVVLQNCNILVQKYSERCFITAQGRTDPNQNTGISIHKCKIQSSGGNCPTYLGRPWKTYSRTVVMQSYLDGIINSAGWYPWSGGSSLSTLYYGEYSNTGPGASTSGRVKWGGYHPSMSSTEASKFTVANLISGNSWLPSTGVIFDAGL
ncbi:hypothetical protein AQUCO_05500025v1 [Aquilegia coerulea]|uniref:Pectinesterase n=1 Tax=Aquilegia coerulea TaxID=218851 RepID=A0A2G5CGS4_AQUCA|nr:hypothetical protein AQUCO_05500025v1 [Aquilegia coerulea]